MTQQEEQQQEIATKTERIVELLRSLKKDALLIRRNENLAWMTAGRFTRRVLLPSDTNVASVLVTGEGERFFLTTNNEEARVADEDVSGLGFQPLTWSWHEDGLASALGRVVGSGGIAADLATGDALIVDLTPLRTPLLPGELARLRAAGAEVAGVVSRVLRKLQPGTTESQMSAMTAAELLATGIEPTVLLMGVDDRILKYKHAVPRGDALKHFGMVNLCARKAGLCISITRFVHFGKMPQALADAFGVAAEVNAALLDGSRAGATSAELFSIAERAYAKAGFPGEAEHHHQGGPAGYMERDWVAAPGGEQRLVNAQALAWNPSIRGGKVEDTVLLLDGKISLLTATPDLPLVETKTPSGSYQSAGVLTL